jgi:glyoxylate/hydroxypyruvate reductase A
MPPVVLLSVEPGIAGEWRAALEAAARAADIPIDLRTHPDDVAPGTVDFIICAHDGPVRDFRPFSRLRAILSIWAGVEKLLANPTLPRDAPLCRLVDDGLTWGMTDYVVAHVMRYHLDIDEALRGVGDGWPERLAPLSRDRRVGVLGLGVLGGDAARALAGLRFDVAGWSRTPRDIPGVDCRHGTGGLSAVLARSEILVTLLPRTAVTENLLDAERLALLPRGARIVNAGRGELIDDAALLAALESGHVAHATLDVFREEPLPAGHPYRRHPRVTVTPHVASATRPQTAAGALIAQIARVLRGAPLAHVVDRGRGY